MNGETIQIITDFVSQYLSLAYFLIPVGVITEGDITLILSGIFSHLGPFSLPLAFFLAYLGAMSKSLIGYFFGGYLKRKYPNSKFLKYVERRVLYYLPRLKEKPIASIFIGKLLYGFFSMNYFILIFLGYINVNFKKFIFYEILANLMWLTISFGAGYLFSFTALQFTKNLQKFFLLIFVFIAAFFILWKIVSFIIEATQKLWNSSNSSKKE